MTAVVFVVMGACTSTASAADLIEGTWNFQGGQVLVQRVGDTSFVGTVTQPTTFSSCPHPVGQEMWNMSGSADRYSGTHSWYKDQCKDNPGGKSTWVVQDTDPTNFVVRFCTRVPKRHAPETDANGNPINGTRCFDLTRAKPPAPGPGETEATVSSSTTPSRVVLPSARKCVSRRSFRIRLVSHRKDPLVKATVFLGKKKLRVVKIARTKRKPLLTARVNLRGTVAKQTIKLRVVGRTRRGKTVVTTRTYHTCTAKITKPKKKSKKKPKNSGAQQLALQIAISRVG